MNRNYELTVLTPLFNNSKDIVFYLDGLRSQTYQNFKILMVDDGCTDDTLDLIKDYDFFKNRIDIIKLSNHSGVIHAKNVLLSLVDTPYACFHNPTGVSYPERFEKQLSYLKEFNKDIVSVLVDTEKEFIENFNLFNTNAFFNKFTIDSQIFTQGLLGETFLFKKEICRVKLTELFPYFGEDLFWFERLVLEKYSFGYVDEFLYSYSFRAKEGICKTDFNNFENKYFIDVANTKLIELRKKYAEKIEIDITNGLKRKDKILAIMPLYNYEDYVLESIQSVLDQTYRNFYLVVVDDCSTDESWNRLNTIKDSRVIKIQNKYNMGPWLSVYRVLREFSYLDFDYFVKVDSDDINLKNRFELQINKLKATCSDMVMCLHERKTKTQRYSRIGENTSLYKRDLLFRLGYFDLVRYGADSEYHKKCQQYEVRISLVNQVLVLAHHSGLTNEVPLGSRLRNEYIERYKVKHRNLNTSIFDSRSKIFAIMNISVGQIDLANETIKSIIDQVDHLFVYLNTPSLDLSLLYKSNRITFLTYNQHFSKLSGWGKLFPLIHINDYVLLLDSGIVYPTNYVENHLNFLESIKNRGLSCAYGVNFSFVDTPLVLAGSTGTIVYHFEKALKNNSFVKIGSANTLAFHNQFINITFNNLDDAKLTRDLDFELAFWAQKRLLPIIRIKKFEDWVLNSIANGQIFLKSPLDLDFISNHIATVEWDIDYDLDIFREYSTTSIHNNLSKNGDLSNSPTDLVEETILTNKISKSIEKTKETDEIEKIEEVGINRLGMYYIINDDYEELYKSVSSQIHFVDFVFVLDNTVFSDEKEIQKITKISKKIRYEVTQRFGSGWLGNNRFNQIAARNYCLYKLQSFGANYFIQCDADEWFSPKFFKLARIADFGIRPIEIIWLDEFNYIVGDPKGHLRGAVINSNFKYISTPIEGDFYDSNNPTRHCIPVCDGEQRVYPDVRLNHMKFFKKGSVKDVENYRKKKVFIRSIANDQNNLLHDSLPKVYAINESSYVVKL